MRAYEFIVEDVSDKSAVKNIVDILTTELPTLYRTLTRMAENYYDNHGELGKGFRFISGGATSKWYNGVFFNHFKPALYKLSETLPRNLQNELREYLSSDVHGGGYAQIVVKLIPLLDKIGKATNNQHISVAAKSASKLVDSYYLFLEQLKNDDDDSEIKAKTKSAKAENPVGQQNASVEKIINDVLSRVDKTNAGQIRNILAKTDNKLAVLQKELTNRGLTI